MYSRVLLVALATMLFGTATLFAAEDNVVAVKAKSKKQGWLGVAIQDVTPRLARDKELKVKEGAYVNEVVEDSPADSAGIKEGDVVTEFNGKKIEIAEDLTQAVRSTKPGTKVSITVNRKGEKKTLTASVGKNKSSMPFAIAAPHPPRVIINRIGKIEGMELMELNKQLGDYFEAPNGRGVLVKEVEEESNAAKAGIKAGDIITKVGDEPIKRFDDVTEALEDADEGDKVTIEYIRKGKKNTATLEISEHNYGNIWYWKDEEPQHHYEFEIQPRLEKMQRELEIKLKKLPRIQKDMEHIQLRETSLEL